jgi:hypothetical protein
MRTRLLWLALALAAALGVFTAAGGAGPGLITGAQIKDHTLSSRDLIDRTVQAHDLAPALVNSLRGERGATGPAGLTGLLGPKGDTGPAGPAGAQGAKGHDGVSGYEITTGDPVAVTADDSVIHARVWSPAGKKPIGGGVSVADPTTTISMVASYPISVDGRLGWEVVLVNPTDQGNTVTPYVISIAAS